MKINWRRKRIIISATILMITAVGTAAASILLLTHNFPKVTVPGSGTLVVSLCNQPTLTASPPTGPSGGMIFSCGLSVNSPTIAVGTIGQFGTIYVQSTAGLLPSGYTDLYVVPAANAVAGSACNTISGSALLFTNAAPGGTGLSIVMASTALTPPSGSLVIPGGINYVYCADFSSSSITPTTLGSFSVSFDQ